MIEPYYADDSVTLYHGDCREITVWLTADVLVTDPPYGRGWRQGQMRSRRNSQRAQADRRLPTWPDEYDGIRGDRDTTARDAVLAMWGDRPGFAFGDLVLPPPPGTRQVLVYRKPGNAGHRGTFGGFRRDVEGVYLLGPWPAGLGGRSAVIATLAPSQGNPSSPQGRYGHPHAKPVDVMETLIGACPPGVIADPFAGSGSTLVAARNVGRRAIGVEIDERYCEISARRLAQTALIGGIT